MSADDIDPTLPHYEVRRFLAERKSHPAPDAHVASLLGLQVGPPYTTDVNAVVTALNESGCWWHLSHLQAVVTPTAPVPGMEGLASNAGRYDREGRPIDYISIFSKENPAWSLCEAWIMATYDLPSAWYKIASAYEEAMKKPPMSREYMMAYYEATENRRQQNILESSPSPHKD